jgi:hypothetical protein
MKRVAQHLNSLRVDERYRKTYLGCLDPAGGRRSSNSDCAKAELIIAQKLAARAPGKFALVGLGASGKDPILVAATARSCSASPASQSRTPSPTRPSAFRRCQVAPSCVISRKEKAARFICMSTSKAT